MENNTWQPIGTAPKNEEILLCNEHEFFFFGEILFADQTIENNPLAYKNNYDSTIYSEWNCPKLTHWMPLQKPPIKTTN